MPTFRLRSDRELLRRAEELGLRPNGSAIAVAAGLPPQTVNSVRNGRTPRSSTIAALIVLFGCTVEDLFEIVDVPSVEQTGRDN